MEASHSQKMGVRKRKRKNKYRERWGIRSYAVFVYFKKYLFNIFLKKC